MTGVSKKALALGVSLSTFLYVNALTGELKLDGSLSSIINDMYFLALMSCSVTGTALICIATDAPQSSAVADLSDQFGSQFFVIGLSTHFIITPFVEQLHMLLTGDSPEASLFYAQIASVLVLAGYSMRLAFNAHQAREALTA